MVSIDGRRNGESVMENPLGDSSETHTDIEGKRVVSGFGGTEEPPTPPSSAQYMGRM
jgi:hypothetical protein